MALHTASTAAQGYVNRFVYTTCVEEEEPHTFLKTLKGHNIINILFQNCAVLYTHCTMSQTYSIVKQHLIDNLILKSSLGHPGHKPSQLQL